MTLVTPATLLFKALSNRSCCALCKGVLQIMLLALLSWRVVRCAP